MRYFYLPAILILFGIFPAISQTELDSLLEVQIEARDSNLFHHYTQINRRMIYVDLEKARTYIDMQMELADELGNPKFIAFAANINAIYYSKSSEYEKAAELFEDVMAKYKAMGNYERVSALLNNIAICNQNLGKLDLALEQQMRSLRIKDSIGAAPAAIK